MSFGQIAGALSLTPEQARAASPHESEVPSDRREASRSRPGQGMIDDSPPRPRGNVRSRRSGRSMDLAGDQHQDQSGGASSAARAPRCHPRPETHRDLRPHQTMPAPGTPPGRGPGHQDATGGEPDSSKLDPTRPRMSRPDLAGRTRARDILKNLLESA